MVEGSCCSHPLRFAVLSTLSWSPHMAIASAMSMTGRLVVRAVSMHLTFISLSTLAARIIVLSCEHIS